VKQSTAAMGFQCKDKEENRTDSEALPPSLPPSFVSIYQLNVRAREGLAKSCICSFLWLMSNLSVVGLCLVDFAIPPLPVSSLLPKISPRFLLSLVVFFS